MERTDTEAQTGDFILDIWVVIKIKRGILVIKTKSKNLLKHKNKSKKKTLECQVTRFQVP